GGVQGNQSLRTASRNAAIKAGSFSPGPRSTPVETSAMGAPDRRTASATFHGSSPPARNQGREKRRPVSSDQSKDDPWPPGRSEVFGGLASNIRWSATPS